MSPFRFPAHFYSFFHFDSSFVRGKVMALPKAKEIASSTPVVIFSKTYCSYCATVKKLLKELNASFKAVELNVEDDGEDIQSALAGWTGQRTVPNVFIGGKHIGGCDATTALHRDGKLVTMLAEAGAVAKAESSGVTKASI